MGSAVAIMTIRLPEVGITGNDRFSIRSDVPGDNQEHKRIAMTSVTKNPHTTAKRGSPAEAETRSPGELPPAEGPSKRGRPREEDRTPAILHAAVELVDEAGYDDLRVQDLADRAGVGLATIYRRWPTKRDLFLDALRAKEFDFPDTGDARADLIAGFGRLAERVGSGGRLAVGCLAAGEADPELMETFRAVGVARLQQHLRRLIASVVGDDDPDLELRADLGPGVLMQRALLAGQPVAADDPLIERLADLTLGPMPG